MRALLASLAFLIAVPATAGGYAEAINPRPMPFVRATRSPFVFPATATPQQFMIHQPDTSALGAATYRAYNPCAHADVRIMTVSPQAPVVTQATDYPGVLKVTSKTEVIDRLSGVRFGRGAETLGSASNPIGGSDRIVSIMLVPVPGYPADLTGVTCEFELLYGTGS